MRRMDGEAFSRRLRWSQLNPRRRDDRHRDLADGRDAPAARAAVLELTAAQLRQKNQERKGDLRWPANCSSLLPSGYPAVAPTVPGRPGGWIRARLPPSGLVGGGFLRHPAGVQEPGDVFVPT
jgi:hypothetical protein